MPRYVPRRLARSRHASPDPSTFARLPFIRTLEDVDVADRRRALRHRRHLPRRRSFGPNAVRAASVMLRPYNANLDIVPFEVLSCVDYGDIAIVPGFTERSYAAIEDVVAPIVAGGRRPGAHRRRPRLHAPAPPCDSLARAGRGHRLRLPHRRLGQLPRREVQPRDVDATSHRGGPRRRRPLDRGRPARVRSSQPSRLDAACATELGLDYLTTEDVFRIGPAGDRRRTSGTGSARGPAFISFDIDVVDPAYAPGTGTPEPGGPSAHDALDHRPWPDAASTSSGFDVVEVIPAYDPADLTAFLAANLAFEMMSLVALYRRASQP